MKKITFAATKATAISVVLATVLSFWACSGDSSLIEPNPSMGSVSSSSYVESSFVPPMQVSSLVREQTRFVIKNAVAQCDSKRTLGETAQNDLLPDTRSTRPTIAYRYAGQDSISFSIEYVQLNCGAVVDSLELLVSNDTIVVNAKLDMSNPLRCLCKSKITFKVGLNSDFLSAGVLVLHHDADLSFESIMPIVDLHVVAADPTTYEQKAINVSADCNHAKNSAANNATEKALLNAASKIDAVLVDTIASVDRISPRALKFISNNGMMKIVIEDIYLTCGLIIESINAAYSGGSTIFAQMNIDPSSPLVDCICPTRVSFEIKNEHGVADASYVQLNGFDPIPFSNGSGKEVR